MSGQRSPGTSEAGGEGNVAASSSAEPQRTSSERAGVGTPEIKEGGGHASAESTASAAPDRPSWLSWRILLWAPKRCRYDPSNPPPFTLAHNILYAFAACFTVANLYYNQPVLNKIAATFSVSYERASSVATLMQSGYAVGLLLLCPLGDLVRRRPFILALTWLTAVLWLGLCVTNDFRVFSALSFLCGLTTVTPQLMLPLVGDYAPPHRKGSSLAIVVSGLMLGMLVARLLSGVVANYTSWRNVYWLSLGLQLALLVALALLMPDYPPTNPSLSYPGALLSTLRLLVTQPLLVQACLVAFCMSASFTCFWTTLTFLLASPPYNFPPVTIGLFSLVSVLVITCGPLYGRLVTDRFVPWMPSMIGQAIALAGVVVGTFTAKLSVAGPVVQAAAIDMGSQTAHVANRAAIYTIDPRARNRLNTAYMVMGFVGQLSGTAIGNRLYHEGGWTWSGGYSIALLGFSIVVLLAKGPHEKGWFGWSGGWKMRVVRPKPADPPSPAGGGEDGSGPDVEAARGASEKASGAHGRVSGGSSGGEGGGEAVGADKRVDDKTE